MQGSPGADPNVRGQLIVVSPVYNDWQCVTSFLRDLADVEELPTDITVILVDDGSTERYRHEDIGAARPGIRIRVVTLGANLGHQRAIAAGLVEALNLPTTAAVVVCDADGEDRPADLAVLWARHLETPGDVIVAQRRKRIESIRFKALYRSYRVIFFFLTGQHLDFGNFSLIPGQHLQRICLSPLLWRHYPATLMRSRLQIDRVPLDRGKRYAGQSRMNLVSLINHGLSGMSSFSDVVYARLLAAAGASSVILLAAVVAGIAVRVSSGTALPGWLALVAVIAALGLAQVIATVLVVSFLTFAVGAIAGPPPTKLVPQFVRSVVDER